MRNQPELAKPISFWLVDVLDDKANHRREMVESIAARFQIKHESPQVILVKDGVAIWSADHFAITEEALRTELLKH